MDFEPQVKLQLWDTAGSDRNFNGLTRMHFNDAYGAIIVYDCSSRQTLEMSSKWVQRVRDNSPEDCIIVLVENKSDLL